MRLPVLLLLPLALVPTIRAQVVINEIVAINNAGYQDQDGDGSDWIELKNTGAASVNLAGWYLTDDPGALTKWQFPSVTVAAGGHLVVFASGKNRAVAGAQLHTNFELEGSGEYLALVQPNGITVAAALAPAYPQQYDDVSWGFAGASTTTRVYSSIATPGTANGPGTSIIVGVTATPAAPADTDPITVSASAITVAGVSVTPMLLRWRVDYGAETATPMVPAGGAWTATIPASASGPGQMVRWRVTGTDTAAGAPRNPIYLSITDSPEYHGKMIADPSVASPLRTLFWFVQNPAAVTLTGTRCSLWHLGEFYDNVDVRIRGNSSTGWPKPSYKFDFNPGYHFLHDPAAGRVEEINVNSTWGDKSFIRQILAFELYEAAGAPGSTSYPIRVERNNTFFSVANFVEQPDERFLERKGLGRRGALYKMYNECTSAVSGVEKENRTWETNNNDLAALVAGIQLTGTALENYVFDNLDIPAVLSYLAATTVMHDNDHVAKNYYVYRDSDGDGEWLFLPWDKDLTWGRNYTLSGGVLNDEFWALLDPYSHPLFGDQLHPKVDGPWNRLIDAVYRVPRLREMYLRRLRTVMDLWLKPPGTPAAQSPLVTRITQLQALMLPDCNLDQALWGVPSYGSPTLTFTASTNAIVTAYVNPRRNHLYTTHGTGPGGTIPAAQAAGVPLRFGLVDASAVNPLERYVQIRNCNATAVDLSGWILAGAIAYIFPGGTVLPAGGVLYVAASVPAFRARVASPHGGQGLFVVGPFTGTLAPNTSLLLLDSAFQLVDSAGDFPFTISTTGAGDVSISVQNTAPGSELWITFSTQIATQPGCGPVLGLGSDALFPLLLPLGTVPFHVTTNASGAFSFAAPPGSIGPGFSIDVRALARSPANTWQISAIRRVTF